MASSSRNGPPLDGDDDALISVSASLSTEYAC